MKSAKELESIIDTWARGETTTRSMVETLQQCELNAYKAGMSEAAEIANSRHGMGSLTIATAILNARDNKTL
jgi:hypothetical protein